jgi:hypothetical protein
LRSAASAIALVSALALGLVAAARAADDFSPAERALFMSKHLLNVRPPATLHYRFVRGGSLESPIDDAVALKLSERADHSCCLAQADFLTGANQLKLPEVEAIEGNPVLLYFLERDIREMGRLTKGQPNYFRKRIRMAIYEGARISEVSLPYRGKMVAARRIEIAPYVDDPLHERFERLVGKRYVFTLSDAVPGSLYAIQTWVGGPAPGDVPLLDENLVLDGAGPLPQVP